MKCGDCIHWYNDDGLSFGICLFDQVERHQKCECKHPGYLDSSKLDEDPCIPPECAGCKHIGLRIPYPSLYPCGSCHRAYPQDYYEAASSEKTE